MMKNFLDFLEFSFILATQTNAPEWFDEKSAVKTDI